LYFLGLPAGIPHHHLTITVLDLIGNTMSYIQEASFMKRILIYLVLLSWVVIWLKPEAQVGPLKGREYIKLDWAEVVAGEGRAGLTMRDPVSHRRIFLPWASVAVIQYPDQQGSVID